MAETQTYKQPKTYYQSIAPIGSATPEERQPRKKPPDEELEEARENRKRVLADKLKRKAAESEIRDLEREAENGGAEEGAKEKTTKGVEPSEEGQKGGRKRYTIIDGEPVEDEEGEYTLAQAKKKIAEEEKEKRKYRLDPNNEVVVDRENGELTLNEAIALQESRRRNTPSEPKKRFRLDENDNPVLDEEEGNLTLAEAETLSRARKKGQGDQGNQNQNPITQAVQALSEYERNRGGDKQGINKEELETKLELQKKEMEEIAQGLIAQSNSQRGGLSDEISRIWNMLPDDWKEAIKKKLLGGGGTALSLTDGQGNPLQLTPDMLPSLIELDKFREEQRTKRERNSMLQDLIGAAREYGGIVLNIFQNLMAGGRTEQGLEGEWANFGETGGGSTQGTGRSEEEIKREVISDLGVVRVNCFYCGQFNIVTSNWVGFRCQSCGQVNIRQDVAEQWRSRESTSSEQSGQQEGETREAEPSSRE